MRTGGRCLIAVLMLSALVACTKATSSDRLEVGSPSVGSPGAALGTVTEWLGVLRLTADVNDLDAGTHAVKAVVDGSIVVSPVACFEGLPGAYAGKGYLLGVVAPTKESLEELLEEVRRPVLFEGRVRTTCLD